MVRSRTVREVEHCPQAARFRIVGPIDDQTQAGLGDRASTHRAGFEGDVESAVIELPALQHLTRLPQGEDFRVGSRISIPLFAVGSFRQTITFAIDHQSTDRNLARFSGNSCED